MSESIFYSAFKKAYDAKRISLGRDEIVVVLVEDAYVADQNDHTTYADLTHEIIAENYQAGGMPLPGKRFEVIDGVGKLFADPFRIPDTSIATGTLILVHKDTGTLIACLRGKPGESFEAEFKVRWPDGCAMEI